MHSHDRTMIAQMGFADPDKKELLHDLACQFLTQPDVAARIAGMGPPIRRPRDDYTERAESRHVCHYGPCGKVAVEHDVPIKVERRLDFEFHSYRFRRSLTEAAINKGDGKYRTTVGFLDVQLEFDSVFDLIGVGDTRGRCVYCGEQVTEWPGGNAPRVWKLPGWAAKIEVKIAKVPVSDAIRQIGLYREYDARDDDDDVRWILATRWAISPHEKKCLDDQRIIHIRLGDGFERFCAEARSLGAADPGLVL